MKVRSIPWVLVLALCGPVLTASAVGRSQVHQVHFAWCVILPTCLVIPECVPACPTRRHTHSPSFCHSCQGFHSLLSLRSGSALSTTISAADHNAFSGDHQLPWLEVATGPRCIKWDQEQRLDQSARILRTNTMVVLVVTISSEPGACPALFRTQYTNVERMTHHPICDLAFITTCLLLIPTNYYRASHGQHAAKYCEGWKDETHEVGIFISVRKETYIYTWPPSVKVRSGLT